MPRVCRSGLRGLRLLRFVPFARPGAGELRQLVGGGRANFHELSNPAEAEVEILVRQQVAQRRQRLQPSRQAAKLTVTARADRAAGAFAFSTGVAGRLRRAPAQSTFVHSFTDARHGPGSPFHWSITSSHPQQPGIPGAQEVHMGRKEPHARAA